MSKIKGSVSSISIEKVKEIREAKPKRNFINGYSTNVHKAKFIRTFWLYTRDGFCCKHCGLKATTFHLFPQDKNQSTKNVYLRLGNDKIYFTLDHILPRSRGGTDKIENLQLLCEPCNTFKGNRIEIAPGQMELEAPFVVQNRKPFFSQLDLLKLQFSVQDTYLQVVELRPLTVEELWQQF